MAGWGYIARTTEPIAHCPVAGTVAGMLDDSPHTPEHRITMATTITLWIRCGHVVERAPIDWANKHLGTTDRYEGPPEAIYHGESQPSYREVVDENTRLRAALAHSELPCPYCSLPAEDFAKCAHGFPGCSRADDMMGCPHLGGEFMAIEAERKRCAKICDDLAERALRDSKHHRVYTAIAGALQKAAADIRRPPEIQETQGGVGDSGKDPA